jgi:RNA polymerase sigma-70 factor, ECF subfamily
VEAFSIDASNVRALQPALFAIAQRALGHPDAAADVVQEMWTSALSAACRFEGRSSVRTWLTRILRRRIADHYRSVRRHIPFDDETSRAPHTPLDQRLAIDREAEVVHRALARLPELEQRAIVLCDIEELERDEVCEQLGVRRGHLRVLLCRGRKKLVSALERSERFLPPKHEL